jgi:hypothetical protein
MFWHLSFISQPIYISYVSDGILYRHWNSNDSDTRCGFHWSEQRTKRRQTGRQVLALFTSFIVIAAVTLYPSSLKVFPKTQYVVGGAPGVYKFLQQQPKDSLIASLTSETDNLPTFTKRSILVGKEYALPFHTKYYAQFRPRVIDLINAQYSSDLNQVKGFIQKYGVSFWLLDRTAFRPEYIANNWIRQYQATAAEAMAKLKQDLHQLC